MTLEERYSDLLQRMEEFVQASMEGDQSDELGPSLMLLAAHPRQAGNNSRVRISGNVQVLAEVLAVTLADPAADEFMDALSSSMERIDTQMQAIDAK